MRGGGLEPAQTLVIKGQFGDSPGIVEGDAAAMTSNGRDTATPVQVGERPALVDLCAAVVAAAQAGDLATVCLLARTMRTVVEADVTATGGAPSGRER